MQPDSFGLETSLFLNETKKGTLKRSYFSRKPLETESPVCDVQLLANQIIWAILTRFVIGIFKRAFSEKQMHADATISRISGQANWSFIMNQIKQPWLCLFLF